MKNEQKEKHVYTVAELTKYMRVILEDSFPSVWVEGEISNYILHSSGHIYFSLRDANAVLKCAMFKRANEKLKFRLKDGMKVICFGSVSVYEARGDYQLIVEDIEPKGVGALQLQFQELKERLKKEGLFDDAHKVPIPYLPTRIGIVTSPTGAAIRDILNIARRRFSNVEIIINPVKVQGAGAKDEIASAIRDFNRYKKIDVMIVTRGGGSLEDLWPFNEEVVARAIYGSAIPVISAVGHEIDYTVSDFVADFRAPTPSAAAELVIPRKEDLINSIETSVTRLKAALASKLGMLAEKLSTLKDSYILRQPLNLITQYEQKIDDLTKDMSIRADHLVKMRNENFNLLIGKLEALSPLGILRRGYSITTKVPDGTIIKDAKSLKAGDRVETRLGSGKFKARVENIETGGRNG
ncbi:MAG: exodeoxyribonuclease VII large subunit [Candidatus Omnitrophota bacterium]|nr:exodeoxyribonuclease VII large subunit [Candidatus Omnitrophota bacterium]